MEGRGRGREKRGNRACKELKVDKQREKHTDWERGVSLLEKKKKPLRKGREIARHPLLFSLPVLWVWLMEREGTEASAQCEEAKWGQCRTSIPLSVIQVYLSLYGCPLFSTHLFLRLFLVSVSVCFTIHWMFLDVFFFSDGECKVHCAVRVLHFQWLRWKKKKHWASLLRGKVEWKYTINVLTYITLIV